MNPHSNGKQKCCKVFSDSSIDRYFLFLVCLNDRYNYSLQVQSSYIMEDVVGNLCKLKLKASNRCKIEITVNYFP